MVDLLDYFRFTLVLHVSYILVGGQVVGNQVDVEAEEIRVYNEENDGHDQGDDCSNQVELPVLNHIFLCSGQTPQLHRYDYKLRSQRRHNGCQHSDEVFVVSSSYVVADPLAMMVEIR